MMSPRLNPIGVGLNLHQWVITTHSTNYFNDLTYFNFADQLSTTEMMSLMYFFVESEIINCKSATRFQFFISFEK